MIKKNLLINVILCEFQLNFEKQLQIIHNYMVKESIYSIEISQALRKKHKPQSAQN